MENPEHKKSGEEMKQKEDRQPEVVEGRGGEGGGRGRRVKTEEGRKRGSGTESLSR